MITVEGVSKRFDNRTAVKDVSFEVSDGEIFVLLGSSGCGKTTMLKMINRLIEPDSGRILLNGEDVRNQQVETLRKGIGFVMQHSGLFPHYTVRQNIAVVPDLLGRNTEETYQKTASLASKLHLPAELLELYPNQLSGGQQQRVGIARALVANPPVLLMDEPFGALDNITRADIHAEFRSLDELKNKTIILVTHDVQEAFELGHRICLMDKGEIVQMDTPANILYRPRNEFVTQFFKSNRLLLEYKIAMMQDLEPFIRPEILTELNIPATTNVWTALQQVSTSQSDNHYYQALTEGFNEYRKMQLV